MTIKFTMEPTDDPDLFLVNGDFQIVEDREGPSCGTHSLDLRGITNYGTDARPAEIRKALDIIEDLCRDPDLGTSGRRNNDAVNLCIAAHVIGFDAIEWIEEMCIHHCIDVADLAEFRDHFERVYEYLGAWGPAGDRGRALDKTI